MTLRSLTGRLVRPLRSRRLLAGGATVVAVASTVAVGLPFSQGAETAHADGSQVTVAWAGGNADDIQAVQPGSRPDADERIPARSDAEPYWQKSGHYEDFKNLKVTVSKTKSLGDEVIDITASGMEPTVRTSDGRAVANFLQVMQCWGPDPLAADFWKTCTFGARATEPGMATALPHHAATRGYRTTAAQSPDKPWSNLLLNPYRTAQGKENTPQKNTSAGENKNEYTTSGLEAFYTAETTNEQPFVPIDANGNAAIGFSTQTASQFPYGGCGDPTSAPKNRCWLVVVPRGKHSVEMPEDRVAADPAVAGNKLRCTDPAQWPVPFGDSGLDAANVHDSPGQYGSPVSPDCGAFANRIVVPLDFDSVKNTCPSGKAERRIIGSEFLNAAFSSWQPKLCETDGLVFGNSSIPGNTARGQLVMGKDQFAVIGDAATKDNIGSVTEEQLANTKLGYAPMVNTGVTIALNVQQGPLLTDAKLTPRLIAKLITQTYDQDIPWMMGDLSVKDVPSRANRTHFTCIFEDPEWVAAGNPAGMRCNGAFAVLVTPAPFQDDAIRVVWSYLLADADARSFLEGKPDDAGQTINPYYLPATNPAHAGVGQPRDLSKTAIREFLRSDETLAPTAAVAAKQGVTQLDSITFAAPAGTYHESAMRVFRGTSGARFTWDPNIATASGQKGDWAKAEAPLPGSDRRVFGVVSTADAAAYRLTKASIAAPLGESRGADQRAYVAPTTDAMSAAARQSAVDGATGFSSIPASGLAADAYPLTFTLNGAVDLASKQLAQDARSDYSKLLKFVAGPGQVLGQDAGQLPEGYAPLTDAQKAATEKLSERILTVETTHAEDAAAAAAVAGGLGAGGRSSSSLGGRGSLSGGSAAAPAAAGAGPAIKTQAVGAGESANTPAVLAQHVLGLTLLTGLGAGVLSPFFLRRGRIGA